MSPSTYEEEPQVSDYRRSVSSYDSNADIDHELTLSTPTILGLFFALALVCACFFGLGYAMGHKTAPPPQVFNTTPVPATGEPKPAPGSAVAAQTTPAPDATATITDQTSAAPQSATVPLNASPPPLSATTSPSSAVRSAPATAASPIAAATPGAPGTFVVQVAAVSSQDVANILLSTLEKKGYAVAVRHEPQDQLLHVQIGPFNDRKEADAMRQRVLADGFNAIVK